MRKPCSMPSPMKIWLTQVLNRLDTGGKMLRDISPLDIVFVRDELCDVLDLLPPEFMEKAAKKLERTLLLIRLAMQESSRAKTQEDSAATIREVGNGETEISRTCTES